MQGTYDHPSDHFTLDNTDIRYAKHTTLGSKDLLYGLNVNNNPTVEDVWNSTPSWGYPWLSSGSAPSPSAQPLILGGLAQDVGGLGAYTMWNDHLYADFTVYRSEHARGEQPLTGTGFPNQHSGRCTLLAVGMAANLGTELSRSRNLWHSREFDSEWSRRRTRYLSWTQPSIFSMNDHLASIY